MPHFQPCKSAPWSVGCNAQEHCSCHCHTVRIGVHTSTMMCHKPTREHATGRVLQLHVAQGHMPADKAKLLNSGRGLYNDHRPSLAAQHPPLTQSGPRSPCCNSKVRSTISSTWRQRHSSCTCGVTVANTAPRMMPLYPTLPSTPSIHRSGRLKVYMREKLQRLQGTTARQTAYWYRYH